MPVPCNVDYVFAVDLDERNQVRESFYDLPVIAESIEDGSEDNLFFVKGNQVITSFPVGNIDISYPYYECFRIQGGKLRLILEGKGRKTGLSQKDSKYDCTFDRTYSLDLSEDDQDELCEQIPGECPDSDSVEIDRRIEDRDGKKVITIDIDASDLEGFKYWEKLPKCIVDGIVENIDIVFEDITPTGSYAITPAGEIIHDGDSIYPGYQVFTGVTPSGTNLEVRIQKPDPLMVWHFTGGGIAEEKIVYRLQNLKKEIESECLRQFRGTVTEVATAGALTATAATVYSQMSFASPVSFLSAATGGFTPYSFRWDFGDGNTAAGPSPSNTYSAPGAYTVTLTATDNAAIPASFTTTNTILRCPAQCGVDGGICDKQAVCKINDWCNSAADCADEGIGPAGGQCSIFVNQCLG